MALGLALVMVSASGAESARGGSFDVTACGIAPAFADNSWTSLNTDPTDLETLNACGATSVIGQSRSISGLAAADILGLSTVAPVGAAAGWRFAAPAGDMITAATFDRDLFLALAPGWLAEIIDANGMPLPGEVCASESTQVRCEAQGMARHTGLNTSSLTIEAACVPMVVIQTTCTGGVTFHSIRVELNSATVTVTDNQPPAITATAGTLLTSSGYQRGVLTGTVSGADNSGVSGVRIYVDGNPIVQSAFNCDYTYPQPCPASATSPTLSLDTTRLADGTHRVQAAVIDAAGNETRGAVEPLLVSNHPPAPPIAAAVTNAPTGWINHPAAITWRNPAPASGLPIAGVAWVACRGVDTTIPAAGCGAAHSQATPLTSLDEDLTTEPAFAGRLPDRYTVFIWLVDSSGAFDPAARGSRRVRVRRHRPRPAGCAQGDRKFDRHVFRLSRHTARPRCPDRQHRLDRLQDRRAMLPDQDRSRSDLRLRSGHRSGLQVRPPRHLFGPRLASRRRRQPKSECDYHGDRDLRVLPCPQASPKAEPSPACHRCRYPRPPSPGHGNHQPIAQRARPRRPTRHTWLRRPRPSPHGARHGRALLDQLRPAGRRPPRPRHGDLRRRQEVPLPDSHQDACKALGSQPASSWERGLSPDVAEPPDRLRPPARSPAATYP